MLNDRENYLLETAELSAPRMIKFKPVVKTQEASGDREVVASELQESLFPDRFSSRALSRPLSAEILFAVLGSVSVPHSGSGRVAIPTSGGLNEISLMAIVNRVPQIEAGTYSVAGQGSILRPQRQGDPIRTVVNDNVALRLGLQPNEQASAVLLLFADFTAISHCYTSAVLVSSLWDAGALLLGLQVAACRSQLSSCIVGTTLNSALASYLPRPITHVGNVGIIALGGSNAEDLSNRCHRNVKAGLSY
jgi:hypothetical protein